MGCLILSMKRENISPLWFGFVALVFTEVSNVVWSTSTDNWILDGFTRLYTTSPTLNSDVRSTASTSKHHSHKVTLQEKALTFLNLSSFKKWTHVTNISNTASVNFAVTSLSKSISNIQTIQEKKTAKLIEISDNTTQAVTNGIRTSYLVLNSISIIPSFTPPGNHLVATSRSLTAETFGKSVSGMAADDSQRFETNVSNMSSKINTTVNIGSLTRQSSLEQELEQTTSRFSRSNPSHHSKHRDMNIRSGSPSYSPPIYSETLISLGKLRGFNTTAREEMSDTSIQKAIAQTSMTFSKESPNTNTPESTWVQNSSEASSTNDELRATSHVTLSTVTTPSKFVTRLENCTPSFSKLSTQFLDKTDSSPVLFANSTSEIEQVHLALKTTWTKLHTERIISTNDILQTTTAFSTETPKSAASSIISSLVTYLETSEIGVSVSFLLRTTKSINLKIKSKTMVTQNIKLSSSVTPLKSKTPMITILAGEIARSFDLFSTMSNGIQSSTWISKTWMPKMTSLLPKEPSQPKKTTTTESTVIKGLVSSTLKSTGSLTSPEASKNSLLSTYASHFETRLITSLRMPRSADSVMSSFISLTKNTSPKKTQTLQTTSEGLFATLSKNKVDSASNPVPASKSGTKPDQPYAIIETLQPIATSSFSASLDDSSTNTTPFTASSFNVQSSRSSILNPESKILTNPVVLFTALTSHSRFSSSEVSKETLNSNKFLVRPANSWVLSLNLTHVWPSVKLANQSQTSTAITKSAIYLQGATKTGYSAAITAIKSSVELSLHPGSNQVPRLSILVTSGSPSKLLYPGSNRVAKSPSLLQVFKSSIVVTSSKSTSKSSNSGSNQVVTSSSLVQLLKPTSIPVTSTTSQSEDNDQRPESEQYTKKSSILQLTGDVTTSTMVALFSSITHVQRTTANTHTMFGKTETSIRMQRSRSPSLVISSFSSHQRLGDENAFLSRISKSAADHTSPKKIISKTLSESVNRHGGPTSTHGTTITITKNKSKLPSLSSRIWSSQKSTHVIQKDSQAIQSSTSTPRTNTPEQVSTGSQKTSSSLHPKSLTPLVTMSSKLIPDLTSSQSTLASIFIALIETTSNTYTTTTATTINETSRKLVALSSTVWKAQTSIDLHQPGSSMTRQKPPTNTPERMSDTAATEYSYFSSAGTSDNKNLNSATSFVSISVSHLTRSYRARSSTLIAHEETVSRTLSKEKTTSFVSSSSDKLHTSKTVYNTESSLHDDAASSSIALNATTTEISTSAVKQKNISSQFSGKTQIASTVKTQESVLQPTPPLLNRTQHVHATPLVTTGNNSIQLNTTWKQSVSQASSVSSNQTPLAIQYCNSKYGKRCVCYEGKQVISGTQEVMASCRQLLSEDERRAVIAMELDSLTGSETLENRTKVIIAWLVTQACNNGSYQCVPEDTNNLRSDSFISFTASTSQSPLFESSKNKIAQNSSKNKIAFSDDFSSYISNTANSSEHIKSHDILNSRNSVNSQSVVNLLHHSPIKTQFQTAVNPSVKFKRRKRSLVLRQFPLIRVIPSDVTVVEMRPSEESKPATLAFFVNYRVVNISRNISALEPSILRSILKNNTAYLEKNLNVSIQRVGPWITKPVRTTTFWQSPTTAVFPTSAVLSSTPVVNDSKIMIVAIAVGVSCVLMMLIIIAIVIARLNSKMQGEFIPANTVNDTITPDYNTQEMIAASVDPAPRITDVPYKAPKAKKATRMNLRRSDFMTSEI